MSLGQPRASTLKVSIVRLVAAAMALALPGCVTIAANPPPYKAVVVDVSPLRAKGRGLFADEVQACVTRSANRLMDGLVARSTQAPTLVLQVESVLFTDQVGDRYSGRGPTTDYMEGSAVIMQGNTVLERVPMLGGYTTTWTPATASPYLTPWRMQGLCDFYVGWMKKKLGG